MTGSHAHWTLCVMIGLVQIQKLLLLLLDQVPHLFFRFRTTTDGRSILLCLATGGKGSPSYRLAPCIDHLPTHLTPGAKDHTADVCVRSPRAWWPKNHRSLYSCNHYKRPTARRRRRRSEQQHCSMYALHRDREQFGKKISTVQFFFFFSVTLDTAVASAHMHNSHHSTPHSHTCAYF